MTDGGTIRVRFST